MKLTFVLLTVAFLSVNAKSFSQNVSFSGKDVRLENVFNAIEKQTGYAFLYTEKVISTSRPVTISASNVPLEQFLRDIFKDQPIGFEINNKSILLFNSAVKAKPATAEVALEAFLPPGDIRGIVVNEAQQPVPGVTVYAKKAHGAAVTDNKGEFLIRRVEDGDTVMFTSINYETQYVPANTSVYMRIKMVERITKLSGVTVYNTGYQTLSYERATGSFAKPDMEVFSKRTGTMDIVGRLEGLVPGVQVFSGLNSTNTSTNGNGVSVRKVLVRGTSTVRNAPSSGGDGNRPLFVVNGVIVDDFTTVNPDDIEDVTVLKDAAAAAIWGARSANGVFVITTKSGSKNSRLTVNYSGFVNYQGLPDFNAVPMLNSRQYIDVARQVFDPVNFPYGSQTFIPPHDQILYDQNRGLITAAEANRKLDSLASINNLSQIEDLWYRPAISTNHTVSVSGGGPLYSFYASLGYNSSQSANPGDKNNTYRLNVTQSATLGSRVRISLNTSMSNTVNSTQGNVPGVTNAFLPYQLFRDAAGNNIDLTYLNGYTPAQTLDYSTRSGISLRYSPLDEMNYSHSNTNTLSLNVTANVSVKLWKGLSFQGTYGYQRTPGTNSSYTDHQALDQRKLAISLTTENPVTHLYPITGGYYYTNNTEQRNWTVRNQLAYSGTFRNGKDQIYLQAGQEVQEGRSTRNNSTVIGYDEKLASYAILDLQTLRNGIFPTVTGFGSLSFTPFQSDLSISRFISYFGLASYSINGKYNLDASVRKDRSSNFASEISSQNKPVWSFGAGWRLDKEKFIKKIKWINDLGLRATYGITGNSPYLSLASQYDIVSILSASSSFLYNQIAGDALTMSTVGNKSLAWERTNNVNIGLNYTVLNARLSGSIDVYRRTTTNLLGSTQLNPLSGYTTIGGNLGKMSNNGIEVSIRSQNVRTKNFSWTTSINLGHNKNKLVSYQKLNPTIANNVSLFMSVPYLEGYPQSPMWAYRFAGLDNLGDPKIILANGTVTKTPNAAKVADLKFMGTTTPTVFGGFSNTFTYKGVSLSGNMIFNMGGVMRMPINSFYSGRLMSNPSFGSGNIRAEFLDRWQKPGDEAFTNIPSYVSGQTANARRSIAYYSQGDVNVVSSSYIKLRDVSLSYDVDPRVTRILRIQRASVFLQTTNFLIWTANDAKVDPEFGGSVPPFRHSYSLGVNLSL